MKLRDFRGIRSVTVKFSSALTVVEGPNEAGKSSVPEAFRMLRTLKASSKARAVKEVQPVGRDVGPEAEVTLTTGPYTLRYRKRWLVQVLTELEILSPTPEQLVGDQAHDRFNQILAETVDTDLLAALDVTQGDSLEQAVLAEIPAVQRQLELDGADQVAEHRDLFALLQDERARYYTSTGKPAKAYAAAIATHSRIEEELGRLRSESASIDALVEHQHSAGLSFESLNKKLGLARMEVKNLGETWERIQFLEQKVAAAVGEQKVAKSALEESKRLEKERATLAAEINDRSTAVEQIRQQLESTRGAVRAAESEAITIATSQEEAARLVSSARENEKHLTEKIEAIRAAAEVQELQRLVEKIDSVGDQLLQARAILDSLAITSEQVDEIADCDMRLRVAQSSAEAAVPKLTVTRLGEPTVEVDGQPLTVGQAETVSITTSTRLHAPGVVDIVIDPGAGADVARDIESARLALEGALNQAGASSLSNARELLGQKVQAKELADRLRSHLELLLDGREPELLQLKLVRAEAASKRSPDISDSSDEDREQLVLKLEAAQRELRAVEEEHLAAEARRQTLNARLASAREELVHIIAQEGAASAELDRVSERLASDRDKLGDEDLATANIAAVQEFEAKRRAAEIAAKEYNRLNPDGVALDLKQKEAIVRTLSGRVDQAKTKYDSLTGQIEQASLSGTYDRLENLEAEWEAVQARLASIERRAESTRLLHEVLSKHRSVAQQKYVAPFKQRIERLGEPLFGKEFTVEVSSDLTVSARTLNGQTVPFHSLSAGAQEQISLLGRLACAQLVSEEGGAPLILDDTLGFADPERLAAVNGVLTRVGSSAQVILLTCQPDRFDTLGDATFVSVTPEPIQVKA